jgi:hypothetical protein
MADVTRSLAAGKNVYEEDIPVVAPGVELIYGPCTVWDITVCVEPAQVVVVNFSNSITAYDSAEIVGKVVISGPDTKHFTFPAGRYCDTGLCAIANNGSADVRVSYD